MASTSHTTKTFRLYFDNPDDMRIRDILESIKLSGKDIGDYIKDAILAYGGSNKVEESRLIIDTLSQINENTHALYEKLKMLNLGNMSAVSISNVITAQDNSENDIIPMSHDTDQDIDESVMNDFMEFMNV